jgi:hypothetical protein
MIITKRFFWHVQWYGTGSVRDRLLAELSFRESTRSPRSRYRTVEQTTIGGSFRFNFTQARAEYERSPNWL